MPPKKRPHTAAAAEEWDEAPEVGEAEAGDGSAREGRKRRAEEMEAQQALD